MIILGKMIRMSEKIIETLENLLDS